MTKTVLLLLLIGHVLGDFYIQISLLSTGKEESFKKILQHNALYLLSVAIVIVPICGKAIFYWAFLASIAHLAIDVLQFSIKKKTTVDDRMEAWIYSIDQIAHFATIFIIAAIICLFEKPISYTYAVQYLVNVFQIDTINILSWVLSLLVIMQPISITIKKVLYRYKPLYGDEETGLPNAGAFIGILERSIILLMLSVNQYAAIGFVLTAKSIARYNKIAENPKFSEYYLLGTLLSAVLVITAYIAIF